MKKYGICLFLFLTLATVCFWTGFFVGRPEAVEESAIPNTVYETETVPDPRPVANQEEIMPVAREEFFLVSETGYLLVFAQDKSTICLYTHIPITDFPQKEQEKLREGIWFPSMMEIFHYLESYTS